MYARFGGVSTLAVAAMARGGVSSSPSRSQNRANSWRPSTYAVSNAGCTRCHVSANARIVVSSIARASRRNCRVGHQVARCSSSCLAVRERR